MRDSKLSYARQMGQETPPVPLPPAKMAWLIPIFSSCGGSNLTLQEISAFSNLHGVEFHHQDIEILIAMKNVILDFQADQISKNQSVNTDMNGVK